MSCRTKPIVRVLHSVSQIVHGRIPCRNGRSVRSPNPAWLPSATICGGVTPTYPTQPMRPLTQNRQLTCSLTRFCAPPGSALVHPRSHALPAALEKSCSARRHPRTVIALCERPFLRAILPLAFPLVLAYHGLCMDKPLRRKVKWNILWWG